MISLRSTFFVFNPISHVLACANVKLSGYTVDGTFSQYLVRQNSSRTSHCPHNIILGFLRPFSNTHSRRPREQCRGLYPLRCALSEFVFVDSS